MEGQKRNTAQLKRIGAVMERRWGLEGAVRKEESENVMERSKDSSRES